MPAADELLGARRAATRGRGQLHGVDGRIDDELSACRNLARLLEEAERKARGDAKTHVDVPPAARRRSSVRRDLGGLRADLEEEAALVRRLRGPQVLDLDGVGRNAPLVVVDLDLDEVGAADLGAKGQAPHHRQVAQRQLAHDAAHDDEREEHPEKQVEEIVRRVDRGEADAQGDADEELPLAGELQPPRRPDLTTEALEARSGRPGDLGDLCGRHGRHAALERDRNAADHLAHGTPRTRRATGRSRRPASRGGRGGRAPGPRARGCRRRCSSGGRAAGHAPGPRGRAPSPRGSRRRGRAAGRFASPG